MTLLGHRLIQSAVKEGDIWMETLLGTATAVEIIEDTGVPAAAVPRVSTATSTVVVANSSTFPRLICRDLLSHIERSRDRKSAGIAEALGSVLNTIVNPPKTLRDISTDFEMATKKLCTIIASKVKFWTETQQSLMVKIRALANNNN